MRLWLIYFSLSVVFISQALAESACSSEQFDETTTIRSIHDGDTLRLRDGRKVRLIGINAPELAHEDRAAEGYALEAKNALKSLFIKDKSISLVYGKDNKDRYGRLLAHVFLSDGQNVQAVLLGQGYARTITLPPNTQFSACYRAMENRARCSNSGLWKSADIIEAKNLDRQHTGFQLVSGRVEKIDSNRNGVWLNLDNKLTVGIRPDNLPLFDLDVINSMLNQTVIVRGWLNNSNRSTPYYIRVRHPSSVQLFSAFSCENK